MHLITTDYILIIISLITEHNYKYEMSEIIGMGSEEVNK